MERRLEWEDFIWWWTTSPITKRAGSGSDAKSSACTHSEAVWTWHCCCTRLPSVTTAMGVSGLSSWTRCIAMSCNLRRPMNTTSVEDVSRASRRSRVKRPSCPVAVPSQAEEATPRSVSGMPANPARDVPQEMPGTYVQPRPSCSAKASSSPARPNTMGSPPFRRTMRRPCRAPRSIQSWMRIWGVLVWPALLPTHTSSASGWAMFSTS